MKQIYLFNIVAWNYRKEIRFPVCKKENFPGLQANRERGKSARASPTLHLTLNEERIERSFHRPTFIRPEKGMFCKELRAQTSSFNLSIRQARQTNNLERFFFFICLFLLSGSLMSQSKKGNREVNWSELQILFIHPKFHDSNNMYHEGVIYSKVLNFKQEALKGSLKKRGY